MVEEVGGGRMQDARDGKGFVRKGPPEQGTNESACGLYSQ
jgi:hypothetical protein